MTALTGNRARRSWTRRHGPGQAPRDPPRPRRDPARRQGRGQGGRGCGAVRARRGRRARLPGQVPASRGAARQGRDLRRPALLPLAQGGLRPRRRQPGGAAGAGGARPGIPSGSRAARRWRRSTPSPPRPSARDAGPRPDRRHRRGGGRLRDDAARARAFPVRSPWSAARRTRPTTAPSCPSSSWPSRRRRRRPCWSRISAAAHRVARIEARRPGSTRRPAASPWPTARVLTGDALLIATGSRAVAPDFAGEGPRRRHDPAQPRRCGAAQRRGAQDAKRVW